MEEKKMTDKKKLIIGGAIGVIAAIIVIIAVFYGRRITAKVMRIAEIKGIVNLEDSGKSTRIVDNMRLHDGNALSTETESYVSVNLDDSKLVTVEEASRAEFVKSGKNIELELTRGSLFFNVMKPLAKDESFDITTSTMVVGIRGTSGVVTMGDDGRANFYLIEGHVHITGINPVTNEKKEIDLGPGQKLTVYLFNDRTVDSVMFEIEKFSEDELTYNELTQIYYDDDLMERIRQGGVLSTVRIEELVNGTRNEDGYSSNADPEVIGEVLSNDRPGPSPAVTPTPTATLAPSPSASAESTPVASPTAAPAPSAARTSAPIPAVTPTQTPAAAPSAAQEADDDDDDSDSASGSDSVETPAATVPATATATATAAPTATETPTATPAPTETEAPTPEPTPTAANSTTVEFEVSDANSTPHKTINGAIYSLPSGGDLQVDAQGASVIVVPSTITYTNLKGITVISTPTSLTMYSLGSVNSITLTDSITRVNISGLTAENINNITWSGVAEETVVIMSNGASATYINGEWNIIYG